MIDWNHLEDRTRNVRSLSHWDAPGGVIASAAHSYHRDLWANQRNRVEVWIEKDALVGVIERVCSRFDVPYFSCRGYVSQSEMWGAAERFIATNDAPIKDGPFAGEFQKTVVLHLGDHDPSGIDMTRDMQDRLRVFEVDRSQAEIKRIALTMRQIEEVNPPPNPAKTTDARFASYEAEHGDESWELDALDPRYLTSLIERQVMSLGDMDLWERERQRQERERKLLLAASKHWTQTAEYLRSDAFIEGLGAEQRVDWLEDSPAGTEEYDEEDGDDGEEE